MLIETNISNIGDPFIINTNDGYYMYATAFDVEGFKVWKSYDLYNWECLGTCLDLSDSWCYKNYWAPEVSIKDNKYIMHYTSRSKDKNYLLIGVAISDYPQGPFIDVYNGPMFDFGYPSIDGHILNDIDCNYLFFSKDCSGNIKENGDHVSEIYVCRLSNDLTSIIGEPELICSPDKDYDSIYYKNMIWNEGPYVLKHNNKYYLTYSANFYASKDYCICLAISDKPMGPYIKCDSINPIYKSQGNLIGPGHNMFFIDKDNKLRMTCHVQTNIDKPSQNRKAIIVDAKIEEDRILFI